MLISQHRMQHRHSGNYCIATHAILFHWWLYGYCKMALMPVVTLYMIGIMTTVAVHKTMGLTPAVTSPLEARFDTASANVRWKTGKLNLSLIFLEILLLEGGRMAVLVADPLVQGGRRSMEKIGFSTPFPEKVGFSGALRSYAHDRFTNSSFHSHH